MRIRRVLLTGASGRVGRLLLPGLRDHYVLRLLDRTPPDAERDTEPRSAEETAGTADDVRIGELTDVAFLEDALEGVDAVVHLAGNPDPGAAWGELSAPNVDGFAKLLAVADRRGVQRVVFASSVHAMGAHEGRRRWPIDPEWPAAPCCAYGATKAFDEALARAYDYRTEMSLIGLRLGLTAEEGDADARIAGWLGPADLAGIVRGALGAEVKFGVYHAVSRTSRARWDITATERDLGYQPAELPDPSPADTHRADDVLITCRPDPQPGEASGSLVDLERA